MAKDNQQLLAKMNGVADGGEKPKSPMQQISDYMNLPGVQMEIRAALGPNADPVRLIRTAKTQLAKNPKLLECPLPSIMGAIIQAAEEGVDFSFGQGWLVQYNTKKKMPGGGEVWVSECQYQRGYRGLIKLVRNSGEISDIQAHPIYRNDVFFLRRGDDAKFVHEPNLFDPGELIGFYCYALNSDGERHVEVMTVDAVNKVRSRSKSKDNGPWVTDYEEMGRKTVVKRACKYLPISVEAKRSIQEEDEREFEDASTIELNLGEAKTSVLSAGKWPALDANTAEPISQASVDDITLKAQEKLKTKRAEVTTDQVVSQIPLVSGDNERPLFFDEADLLPGDRE